MWWTIHQKERETRRISSHTVTRGAKSREVGKQSLIYGIFFFNTYAWLMLFTAMRMFQLNVGVTLGFLTHVLYAIFFPSQGFWNFLIFLQPRYKKIRRHHSDKSCLWAGGQAIIGHQVVARQSIFNSNNTNVSANTRQSNPAHSSYVAEAASGIAMDHETISKSMDVD